VTGVTGAAGAANGRSSGASATLETTVVAFEWQQLWQQSRLHLHTLQTADCFDQQPMSSGCDVFGPRLSCCSRDEELRCTSRQRVQLL
jgi:hypothetical protein